MLASQPGCSCAGRIQTGKTPLEQLRLFLVSVLSSVRDLLPIVLVVAFFQVVVLQEPVPNLERILVGSLLVVAASSPLVAPFIYTLF